MYKEMMMNDDNLESNLLTSSLLKIRSLYKFCRVTSCTCLAGDLQELNCIVPTSKVRGDWRITATYTIATIVTSVTDSIG